MQKNLTGIKEKEWQIMFYTIKQKNKELYIMIDDFGVVQKTNNKKILHCFWNRGLGSEFYRQPPGEQKIYKK